MVLGLPEAGDVVTRKRAACPQCGRFGHVYRRPRVGGWVCERCKIVFNVPVYVVVSDVKAPVTRENYEVEMFSGRQQVKRVIHDARIKRIYEYHKAHPGATQKELRTYCHETFYMIERYWDEVGRYVSAEAKRKKFKKWPDIHPPTTAQLKALRSGVRRARYARLRKIRAVHRANPEYNKNDLRMVCFESQYMVDMYWNCFVK